MTRSLNGNVANLTKGRVEPCDLYRPHTWLLASRAHVCFPLSLWLRGGRELRDHPGAGIYKDFIHKVSVEKEDVVNGLKALKIRCEEWDDGKPATLNTVRLLWLAVGRNYLPIKTEGYIPRLSQTHPVEVGWCADFREIRPGIWLPFRRSVTCVDQPRLALKKMVVVSNVEETSVDRADANPQYTRSFFQEVGFPSGTLVYEVDDGRITKAYETGVAGRIKYLYRGNRGVLVIIALNVVIILIGAGVYGYGRLCRRRKQCTGVPDT